jgi:solute carrier family 39 (zinc transporter), member 1/2/3
MPLADNRAFSINKFIFNPYWQTASIGKLCYALTCFALGAALMALLGKWA